MQSGTIVGAFIYKLVSSLAALAGFWGSSQWLPRRQDCLRLGVLEAGARCRMGVLVAEVSLRKTTASADIAASPTLSVLMMLDSCVCVPAPRSQAMPRCISSYINTMFTVTVHIITIFTTHLCMYALWRCRNPHYSFLDYCHGSEVEKNARNSSK